MRDLLAESCTLRAAAVLRAFLILLFPLSIHDRALAQVSVYANYANTGSATADVLIARCIATLPSTGGVCDARGLPNQSWTTALVISKPVHLLLSGNLTYSGSAISSGLILFASGSSGSTIECLPSVAATDSGQNGLASTGNPCAIVLTPTGSMPAITIASGVHDITFKNLGLVGNSNVTDGIQHNGSTALVIEHCFFSAPSGTGVGSGPAGWAISGTTLFQDGSVVRDTTIVNWKNGIQFDATGGGTAGPILNNLFIFNSTGQYINLINTFDSDLENIYTGFSRIPSGNAGITINGASVSYAPRLMNIHDDGMTCIGPNDPSCTSGKNTVFIKFAGTVNGGVIAGSSLDGNTNNSVAANDPDRAIDLGPGVQGVEIFGNNIANYASGGLKSAGSNCAFFNNVFAVGHAGSGSAVISGSANFGATMSLSTGPSEAISAISSNTNAATVDIRNDSGHAAWRVSDVHSSPAHNLQLIPDATANFRFYIGAGGPGDILDILSTGNVQAARTLLAANFSTTAAGSHVNQNIRNSDLAGVLKCSIGKATKTFATAFSSTPVVVVSDETAAGGARVSAKSASAFTVTCTGATDVVDYLVIGNAN